MVSSTHSQNFGCDACHFASHAAKPARRRFHARTRGCAGCPLRGDCVPGSRNRKTVVISADHTALLRARRRRLRWSEEDRRLYERHRWRSEGFHGEAKTWHGLGRAARLGQHEGPVLPGGRRDQPEAARGRFLCPILRHRHDSNARSAPFRAFGAAGRLGHHMCVRVARLPAPTAAAIHPGIFERSPNSMAPKCRTDYCFELIEKAAGRLSTEIDVRSPWEARSCSMASCPSHAAQCSGVKPT